MILYGGIETMENKKYEGFTVLYDDKGWILLKHNNKNLYTFGVASDFDSFYGFPVNQSCLSIEKLKERLGNFINIDEKYIDILGEISKENIKRWKDMLLSIESKLVIQ